MARLLIILIIITLRLSLMAQQDPLVAATNSNLIYYMPGSIGRLPYLVTNILHRKQWSQFRETPNIQIISIQRPFSYERMAGGLQVLQESFKDFNNKSIKIYYAYKIRLGKGKLSGGIEGGIAQYGFSLSDLVIKNEDDELLAISGNVLVPDVGVGLFYYDPNFEVGLSIKHLNNPALQTFGPKSHLNPQLYGFASRKLNITTHYYFRPFTLIRYSNNNSLVADFLLEAGIQKYLQISVGFRTQRQLIIQTSLSLDRLVNNSQFGFVIGYSYDIAKFENLRLTSNEIMLTINYRSRPDPAKIKKRNKISSPLLF